MFERSSLFAIAQGRQGMGTDPEILRISMTEATRREVARMFEENANWIIRGEDGAPKTAIEFHADYTAEPESDEFIEIKQFELPAAISSAIDDPLSVELYKPDADNLPLIRALFVGESCIQGRTVAFQRFKTAQYLKASSLHLMFSSDTMHVDGEFFWERLTGKVGLTITPAVDVLFEAGSLKFISPFFAKQVLDLSEYYREAGKAELEAFASLECFEGANKDLIVSGLNSWERRKIASISGARILEEHSVKEMASTASTLDYDLPVKGEKLVFPEDKAERKRLLRFLDEDMYRGVFTGSVYQTNSKFAANSRR